MADGDYWSSGNGIKGNWRLALLECGGTVGSIQEPGMEDNVVNTCIVVTRVMIQILEKIFFLIIR